MNTSDNNIEFQVQLWALVGPIIAVATVATLLVKGSAYNLYLSWTLVAGILLSWKWKVRGLVGALAALILMVGYHYLDIPADERLWHLGMSVAIGLTFFVTALSFDEIESLVGGMRQESSSRLKSLLQLDEKLETVHNRLENEKNSLMEQLQVEQEKSTSYERLIEVTREEILNTHAQQEHLLRELFEKRHALNKLKEQVEVGMPAEERSQLVLQQRDQEIEALREELAKLEQDDVGAEGAEVRKFQAMYKQLRQQFDEKSRHLDQTRKELFHAKERAMCVENEQQQKLLDRNEMEKGMEQCLAQIEEERDRFIRENESLQDLVGELMKKIPETV